jgi:hypothetical protein
MSIEGQVFDPGAQAGYYTDDSSDSEGESYDDDRIYFQEIIRNLPHAYAQQKAMDIINTNADVLACTKESAFDVLGRSVLKIR